MVFVLIVVSYLLGTIPAAVLVGRMFYHVDVREHGSGNSGTINTIRVLGLRAAIPVLLFDILKGFLAVQLSALFPLSSNYDLAILKIAFGSAAVIGHIFPFYMKKMRGGKGVATLYGAFWALHWPATLLYTVIYLASMVITKLGSLSSMLATLSLPISMVFIFEADRPIVIMALICSILVLFTHKKNIIRLVQGKEAKMKFKKSR